jgi:site-specific DNA-methyltransferase (adenine-specific)
MNKYELHKGDCIEFMRTLPDKYFDLCLTDPPYGIGAGKMNLGFSQSSRMKKSDWDSFPPSDEVVNKMISVSKFSVIWGGNYFNLQKVLKIEVFLSAKWLGLI